MQTLCAFEEKEMPLAQTVPSEIKVIEELIEMDVLSRCCLLFHDILKQLDIDSKLHFSVKQDGSLVSTLELEIEKKIAAYLQQVTPWAGFRGEEGIAYESQLVDSPFRWYLDPIDGTLSFKNNIDTFAFVLTLVGQGEALATVIEFPRLEKTFKAYKGRGATMNGSAIFVKNSDPSYSIFAVSDHYTFSMTNRHSILSALQDSPYIIRTYTDIYGYSLVAEGKCAGKFDAAGGLWDLWPGYLLIKEAGGECLFFPVEEPNADLAGSMLVGAPNTISCLKEYINLPTNSSALPILQ
ncbi:MAG: 3'(2'),5'-bisphosphate nucleotidase CysQ [Chlamydiales bacterium]|nr:3'(2'),5'-bisphosphate nucleotidase CysQ [Chlamydiales bacterium]